MTRRFVICRSLLAASLIATACSSPKEPAPAAPPEGEAAAASGSGTLVVGRAPGGAYVMLEATREQDFPPPAEPTFMDQSSQMFVPGELVARSGQEVKFRSSEDVMHNVRVIRSDDKKPIFNIVTPPWGAYSHTFDEPGIYDVTCDIHSVMRATILVSNTPYATIADGQGRFTFENVVPGSYRVVTFVEGKRKEQPVRISGTRTEVAFNQPDESRRSSPPSRPGEHVDTERQHDR
jgi:plastocyanin